MERESRFWIVWSPTGPYSPRRKEPTQRNALAAAESMAKRHPGQDFYVLRAEYVSKVEGLITRGLDAPPVRPDDPEQTHYFSLCERGHTSDCAAGIVWKHNDCTCGTGHKG